MQPFEHRSVRYWSKEINGTLTGGPKINFFNREIDGPAMAAAPVEFCQFVVLRSPRGRLGSLCRHVQSPTPHARPLPSVDIYGNSPSQTSHLPMICQRFRSRALWGAPSTGACGVGDYPTSDPSHRESPSRSASTKIKYLGPMAPRPRKKR